MKIITTFAILAICASVNAQTNIDSGLVACYPFTGNANDISGHNLNGIVNGAKLTNDRFGKSNNAYLFNGISDVIQVGNNIATYLSNNEVTVSVWVRSDLFKQQCIFMLSPDNFNDRFMGLVNFNQSGTPYSIWDFGDIYNNGRISIIQQDSNKWEHYIFWSSQKQNLTKIYRNSKLLTSGNHNSVLSNLNRVFLVGGGSDQNGSKFYFNGAIDDIRIYNRAISDSEVTHLYKLMPAVANFTQSKTTICKAHAVNYTSTSSKATSLKWTFVGGNPSTSTLANPTVTYTAIGNYKVTLVANGANASTDTIVVSNALSVVNCTALETNEAKDQSVVISPNPNNGVFKFENFSSVSVIEIYNYTGKKIHTISSIQSNNVLDLSDQPKGIYFIKIINKSNEIDMKKMIIE